MCPLRAVYFPFAQANPTILKEAAPNGLKKSFMRFPDRQRVYIHASKTPVSPGNWWLVANCVRRSGISDYLNTTTQEGVNVNFPFLDKHQGCNEVYRTSIRERETYDQIGLFSNEDWLPIYEINETMTDGNPAGPNYGVFNFIDLFAEALGVADSARDGLIKRVEHKVSDHMPLWLRLPLPEKTST